MNRNSIACLFFSTVILGLSAHANAQCLSNADCKANRVCINGTCKSMQPQPAPAPYLPPQAAPTPYPSPSAATAPPVGQQPQPTYQQPQYQQPQPTYQQPQYQQPQPTYQQPPNQPPGYQQPQPTSENLQPDPMNLKLRSNLLNEPDKATLLLRAEGGRKTGSILGLTGCLLAVIGGAVTQASLGAGLQITNLGFGLVTVGAWTSTISLTLRHGGMRDAGYDVSAAPNGKAWVLTVLSAVFYFGAIPVSIMALDKESLGLALASLGMWATGGLLAAWALDTDEKWRSSLESAPKGLVKISSKTSVTPAFSTSRNLTGKQQFMFGLGGAF
jgi:hypothetical protein